LAGNQGRELIGLHRVIFIAASVLFIQRFLFFVRHQLSRKPLELLGQITFAPFVTLLKECQHLWVDFYGDTLFLADHGFSVAHLLVPS
jgi:hypothetical protein